MTKTELVKQIYKLYEQGRDHLKFTSVEEQLIIDNIYVETLEKTIDLLMQQLFTEAEREIIDLFLFELRDASDD